MIKIDEAIDKHKTLNNISDGGAACYDFGDVVLVKYKIPLKYLKQGERSRNDEEKIMESINEKIKLGLNSPKHLEVKRIVEGDEDICYVLEEKCKGINCASTSKYGASLDKVLKDLNSINNIPFKQYEKLVHDACMISELGYEKKNKNLFYDKETGFWFIDFIYYHEEEKFDEYNPISIFKTIEYTCPNPIQISSRLDYNYQIPSEYQEEYNNLVCSINGKFILACKKVIPLFNKYEFFYLLESKDNIKEYLMNNKYTNHDLLNASSEDIRTYEELISLVVNDICDKIANDGIKYWDVNINLIRNTSNLFSLQEFYKRYVRIDLKKEDYEDEYMYDINVENMFTNMMMNKIYTKLCKEKINNNIEEFILEYESNFLITRQNKANML